MFLFELFERNWLRSDAAVRKVSVLSVYSITLCESYIGVIQGQHNSV